MTYELMFYWDGLNGCMSCISCNFSHLTLYQMTNFRLVQIESICRRQNKFFLELVENIVGKGENAGYQHFLLSNNVFQRFLFQGH